MTNTCKAISVALLIAFSNYSIAQQIDAGTSGSGQSLGTTYNTITTAVPFLSIAPDSRGGGMGDIGAGTSTDVWSQHWNASKYALAENDFAVGLTYTPWLAHITNDIHLLYAAGYKKLGREGAFGAALRYFSVGEILEYDENGIATGNIISPREFAIDFSYSRKLADKFVMGLTGRFISSNLHGEINPDLKPGRAIAADISGTYFEDKLRLGTMPAAFRAGFNISNIGSKIAYTASQKDFIPTNLRLGAGLKLAVDKHNDVGFYLDLNKLLVPTPPQRILDENGNFTGQFNGKDPDVSPITGIFQSFYDAPGGFQEEMKEVMISGGVEYWYNKQFALRGGYFHEAKTKGNRKYFTLGLG
ncbi:MAG: type IX secretion system outer membrane channel protein PorV, partial [Bacteroidales bacterium]|nr:type IX secretion system outer membrane channel protein PorV [Bacteroidales bacterium]